MLANVIELITNFIINLNKFQMKKSTTQKNHWQFKLVAAEKKTNYLLLQFVLWFGRKVDVINNSIDLLFIKTIRFRAFYLWLQRTESRIKHLFKEWMMNGRKYENYCNEYKQKHCQI